MNLCAEGKRISAKCENICISKDGEPTELYRHLQQCDECAELRERWIERIGAGVK